MALLHLLLSLESLSTLGAVAVDRYLHICRPLSYQGALTRRRVGALLAFTWAQAALLAACPLLTGRWEAGWGGGRGGGQGGCLADDWCGNETSLSCKLTSKRRKLFYTGAQKAR